MTNYSILLVEDDPATALRIESLIHHLGHQLIKTVDNSEDALEWIEKSNPDLILMDIKIEGKLNGIEVAEKINDKFIPIIFITGHEEEALYERAKKVAPIAYLLKPFNKLSLQAAIQSAIRQLRNKSVSFHSSVKKIDTEEESQSLFIRRNNFLLRIKIAKIQFLKSEGNYCEFHTDKKYVIKISLVKVLTHLPQGRFIRIHHRYVVQFDLIDKIDISANEVYISNTVLPLGPRYRESVLSKLNKL